MDKTNTSTYSNRARTVRRRIIRAASLAVIALVTGLNQDTVSAAPDERPVYIAVGNYARPPIGWVQFCGEHAEECRVPPSEPRDVRLTTATWKQLNAINNEVNSRIQPATDIEIYGKVEYWTYPADRGDCEDYVLLKRHLLIEAGWPRSALLITVVRDQRDDGHAVLTVRTDRGEFILDNQVSDILPWHETGYRYVKRQDQSDPNLWVSLGDNRPRTPITASDRR